jgi:L-lactate dehydrogenase complex protein LldG
MSSAREEILARVGKSLGRQGPLAPEALARLEQRMAAHPVHVQPKLEDDLSARFIAKLQAVHVTTRQVGSLNEVSEVIAQHLEAQSLPARVVMARDTLLQEIEWPKDLHIEHRAAADGDMLSVTGAFAAVAETGSVVLLSRQNTPTTLNFLPEEHIVVVREEQILPHIEDVWSLLRQERSELPRTVNFITGPSKTADVEQTIHYGAHGPRRLQVIVVARRA